MLQFTLEYGFIPFQDQLIGDATIIARRSAGNARGEYTASAFLILSA